MNNSNDSYPDLQLEPIQRAGRYNFAEHETSDDWQAWEHLKILHAFPKTREKKEQLKVNEVQVIRRLLHAGVKPRLLANLFDISYFSIVDIKNGNTWSRLPYVMPELSAKDNLSKMVNKPKFYISNLAGNGWQILDDKATTLLIDSSFNGVPDALEYLEVQFGKDGFTHEVQKNDRVEQPKVGAPLSSLFR